MNGLSKRETVAVLQLYDYIPMNHDSIEADMEIGYLTINEGPDGDYAWYFDGIHDVAICINTLEIVEGFSI